MVVRRQDAVFHPHQVIETQNQVRRVTIADQNDLANIGEAEVAIISCAELVLKRAAAMKSNSGRLSDGCHVLSYLAFLAKATVGAQLVVTGHYRRVAHVHYFAGAIIRKDESLSEFDPRGLVLSLRADSGGY